MEDLDRFDPSLFGVWGAGCDYRGIVAAPDEPLDAGLAQDIRIVLLEIKSAADPVSPAEELRRLLNEMTIEMRAQFATFRELRESAARALADGDEAAQKLARADVKAATDAMSLIVRTLEKVDSLQRQLARDRDEEAERMADGGGYEEAKARFITMIEERANERAAELYQAWKATGPPDGLLAVAGREGEKPANVDTGDGGIGKEDVGGLQAEELCSRDDR